METNSIQLNTGSFVLDPNSLHKSKLASFVFVVPEGD